MFLYLCSPFPVLPFLTLLSTISRTLALKVHCPHPSGISPFSKLFAFLSYSIEEQGLWRSEESVMTSRLEEEVGQGEERWPRQPCPPAAPAGRTGLQWQPLPFLIAWPPLLATRPADSWVSRRQSLGIQSTPHTTARAPYLPSHVHRIRRHIPAHEMSTKCLLKSAMTKWYLYYYDTSQVLKEFLLCSEVRGALVADIHQLFSFQLSKWPFIASDSWTSRSSFPPFMGNCSFFLLSFRGQYSN